MKLQLALDDITLDDAVELLDKVHTYVDIIEVGSPFIIEEGMRPVRIFKEKYPDCEILADTKIMDAGEYEAEETFKAGADYCTVLGVTDTLTIEGCVKAAKEYGKQTMVDMICVEDVPKRVKEIEAVGVDFIGVHVGVDQRRNVLAAFADFAGQDFVILGVAFSAEDRISSRRNQFKDD